MLLTRNYHSEKGVYGFNAQGWNELQKRLNEGNTYKPKDTQNE
jgi:hypothetical protein